MILAGIDEAGYGPILGPLVVGCCAFELDADPAGDLPCLWKQLGKVISPKRSRDGRKLHVNDSKQVYTPSAGLKELERSILAIAAAWKGPCGQLDDLIGLISPDVQKDMRNYRWYGAGADERFPLEQDAISVQMIANALRIEMDRVQTRCVHLAARVMLERELNRMFDATRNKGDSLFSIAAIHLDYLLRNFSDRGLVIFCDRQGAREHYGRLLRLMFDDWSLEVIREKDGYSEYRLLNHGRAVRLIFCEKAETQCMSVAVASMLSKYLREALMRRFNTFWRQHLPQIAPTAGYYTDGMRFLQDIATKRVELGIGDAEMIRSR